MNSLYSDSAWFGRGYAHIQAIIITVFMVAMAAFMVVKYLKKGDKTGAEMVVFVAAAIVGIAWLNVFLVRTFKPVAALEGASDAFHLVRVI